MQKSIIGLLVVSSLWSMAFAARPFSVEDSGVLEKGFELELGYSGSTAGESKGTEKTAVLNYALVPEKIQVGYERTYIDVPRHAFGNADSVLTAKYALAKDQALKANISFIDGDEKNGFGNEYTEYGLTYALEGQLYDAATYFNLGLTTYNPGDWYADELVQNTFNLGLGIRFPVLENLDVCAEATKAVVRGDYNDSLAGYVGGMLGVVWTVYDMPVDISYASQPDSKDFTYALGTTLAF
jgi:hypothetical protein